MSVQRSNFSFEKNVPYSGALRDLVPCALFKKRKKHPWRSVTFLQPATLLKVALLHGCFSRFFKLCTW